MEEEEEMWFNEDDDFDDSEPVLATSNDILTKKIDTDLDNIGKMIEKKQPEANGPKINNNSQKGSVLNSSNPTVGTGQAATNTLPGCENKLQLFKRVSKMHFDNFTFKLDRLSQVIMKTNLLIDNRK